VICGLSCRNVRMIPLSGTIATLERADHDDERFRGLALAAIVVGPRSWSSDGSWRMCADADPWQILVTERVFAAAGSLVVGEDAGSRALRGFSQNIHAYSVKGIDSPRGHRVSGDPWTTRPPGFSVSPLRRTAMVRHPAWAYRSTTCESEGQVPSRITSRGRRFQA
jgi:hypothetical protein